MVHPVYVCLEHKLTMHTCRNVGVHCKTHHDMDYILAEKRGIVVKIEDCDPQSTYHGRCPSPKDRAATEIELIMARNRSTKPDS